GNLGLDGARPAPGGPGPTLPDGLLEPPQALLAVAGRSDGAVGVVHPRPAVEGRHLLRVDVAAGRRPVRRLQLHLAARGDRRPELAARTAGADGDLPAEARLQPAVHHFTIASTCLSRS